MIGYDEQHSIDFGLGINAANDEYAALHGGQRINDGGMTSVMSQRAAWDFYVGGLDWPTSKQKHLDEYRAQYGLPPVGVPPHPNPAPGHLVNLVAQGQFFGLETGERFTAIQCSDFNLLNRWQHSQDIGPVLQQRRDCGYNLLRVWTAFDIPGIGTFTDIDYARIPAFVALCADYGLYVEFCAYTGINDPAHWNRLHAAARLCSPRPILELVNELDQNTNEPDSEGRIFNLHDHSQPSGVLSAHGSNGSQMQPVLPHWSYATFHTNGAPEEQRKVGHNAFEIWNGPTLANETSRCPDGGGLWAAGNRFDLAADAANGAALLCAGSCFHSVRGKTSELWDGDELAGAQAWTTGARAIDLTCQAGPYVHRQDLETPDLLRVYERPVSGHVCLSKISK